MKNNESPLRGSEVRSVHTMHDQEVEAGRNVAHVFETPIQNKIIFTIILILGAMNNNTDFACSKYCTVNTNHQ